MLALEHFENLCLDVHPGAFFPSLFVLLEVTVHFILTRVVLKPCSCQDENLWKFTCKMLQNALHSISTRYIADLQYHVWFVTVTYIWLSFE